ncbi:protease-associated domain-containing protein, partial [Streptomyces katsurahamanus]|uniref:hypothetical protein n=1 Tax=Streptomyces katsurahamanus TaxID=2577098 RepID=UPI0018866798
KPVDLRLDRRTDLFQGAQIVYREKGAARLLVSGTTAATAVRLSAVPSAAADGGRFEYLTKVHLVEPQLPSVRTVGSGLTLHPAYLGPVRGLSNPHLDGRHRLRVVDVGAGRTEDYAGKDVSGGIALIAASPETPAGELLDTAAKHGAGAALIYG